MITFKWTGKGRQSNALKEYMNDVRDELQANGITEGNFTYNSKNELDSIKRVELKNIIKTKEPIQSEPIQKEPMAEIKTEAPKVENTTTPEVSTDNFSFDNVDFTGINEEIKQRVYNEMPVTEHMGQDIPEPEISNSFQAMLDKQKEEHEQEETANEENQKAEIKSEPVGNPAMNDLSDKDKQYASEQLVDMILSGYDALHGVAIHYASFNEKKIGKLIQDGDIDPNITFPIDLSGQEVNISEYAEVYNEDVKEILTPTEGFNESVRPAMIREAKRMNLGITDRQFIIGAFVKDAATKTAQVVGLKRGVNQVLDSLKELQKITKNQQEQQTREARQPDIITRKSEPSFVQKPSGEVEDVEYETN
jgi:hypothetical protein